MNQQWLDNKVTHAHERITALEKIVEELKNRENDNERIVKLEGEIRAMKARMGKKEAVELG